MLRVVVVTDMKIQHAMKDRDHPVAAPHARDHILQGKPCILLRREAWIGRLYITVSPAHAWLHQLVMQEKTLVVHVLRLQFELRCPPGCLVVDIGQRFARPGDVDVGLSARKS